VASQFSSVLPQRGQEKRQGKSLIRPRSSGFMNTTLSYDIERDGQTNSALRFNIAQHCRINLVERVWHLDE